MPGPSLGGVDAEQAVTAFLGAVTFIGAVVVGIRSGLKKSRENEADPGMRIAGGVLMDNQSMLMLSERLKDNTEAQAHLRDDIRELTHQIERLRDKL